MDPHRLLVSSLVSALQSRGYTVLKADDGSHSAPERIGRHEPDVLARDPNGLLIIGEAKTENDISSQISKEQFLDFSNRIMSDGPLRGKVVPLHIIVPQRAYENLKNELSQLGLATKIGDSIIIWTN